KGQRLRPGLARCTASWSLPRDIWRKAVARKHPRFSGRLLSSRCPALRAFSTGYFITRAAERASPSDRGSSGPRTKPPSPPADPVRPDGVTARRFSYQAADDMARGPLRQLPSAPEGDELPIHLLYPGGRHPPPKLRAFLDFARPRLRRRCEAIMRAIRS